jgi:hypothetical protein
MGLVLTILLLGLMASLSPSTLVVFLLLLATARARQNAAAFLIGWTVSLSFVFVLSYVAGGSHDLQVGGGHAALAVIEILLGLGLGAIGVRAWRRRHLPPRHPTATTRWTGRLDRLNPAQAAVVGVLEQPWTLTAAAAVVVVRHHSAFLIAVVAFALFALASTATVACTFLYFARSPGQAEAHLRALRDLVVSSGPVLFAVATLLVAAYLVFDGARGLL